VSAWIDRLVREFPDDQRLLVERYTDQLLQAVRRKLPDRFRGRVDPEDIVQSVYRSFFSRLRRSEFSFANSVDIWRLLIVMTLHKVTNAINYHTRNCRDVRREFPPMDWGAGLDVPCKHQAGPEDVAALCELLEDLVADLPPSYREIVTLRLAGYSHHEIASQVSYSTRTVQRVLANVQMSALKRWGRAS
jgi:RNA polymerase sigma-70 factor (ECF subfamily)